MSVRLQLITLFLVGNWACAKDLEIDSAPVDPSQSVVAQFDPTHPIPVLQLIPRPTALAQKIDPNTGGLTPFLDQERVRPETCQLPTEAQCLALVQGWPTSTKPVLFFSGELDSNSISAGIRWFEQTPTGLIELTYTASVTARPAPPERCQSGDNGTDPVVTYTRADVPPGIQVTLTPATELKPETNYFILVWSDATGGLRSGDGKVLEASALFYALNVGPGTTEEQAPVRMNGEITDPLIRSQVQDALMKQYFFGREFKSLSTEEKNQFAEHLTAQGRNLRGLYDFFRLGLGTMMTPTAFANGTPAMTDHRQAVFVNFWTTAPNPPTTVVFDPQNGRVPFPNDPLLLRNIDGRNSVQIPVAPTDNAQTLGLKSALTSLSGFTTTGPIIVPADVWPTDSDLSRFFRMYRLSTEGAVAEAVPVTVEILPASDIAQQAARIWPNTPLQSNSRYVIGLVSTAADPFLDATGVPVAPNPSFEILKRPEAFINEEGQVSQSVLPILQCLPLAAGGDRLADDITVAALASQLEFEEFNGAPGLNHPAWQSAVSLIATHESISPAEVLLAWTHTTQDLFGTLQGVRNDGLVDDGWETLIPGPRIVGPTQIVEGRTQISEFIGIAEKFCLPLCLAGFTNVPTNNCLDNGAPSAALRNDPICVAIDTAYTSDLDQVARYTVKGYRLTAGNPFASGTFDPQRLAVPDIVDLPIWVVTATTSEQPSTGFPGVIYAHGLGDNKESGLLLANSLARQGLASILIDLPLHGERASDLIDNQSGFPCFDDFGSPNIDPHNVTCNPLTQECTGGCDDQQDASGTGFITPNALGSRDNLRQAVVDLLTLLRALREEAGPGQNIPEIDPAHISFSGLSLGGIVGGSFLAQLDANELDAATISTSGGGLIYNVLFNTIPDIREQLYLGLTVAGVCEPATTNFADGCKDTDAFRQFAAISQWIIEPGDSLATAVGIPTEVATERLLVQSADPDPVIPQAATSDFVAALGLTSSERNQIYDFSGLPASEQGLGCHPFVMLPVSFDGLPCGTCFNQAFCTTMTAQTQLATFIASSGDTVLSRILPSEINGVPCSCP